MALYTINMYTPQCLLCAWVQVGPSWSRFGGRWCERTLDQRSSLEPVCSWGPSDECHQIGYATHQSQDLTCTCMCIDTRIIIFILKSHHTSKSHCPKNVTTFQPTNTKHETILKLHHMVKGRHLYTFASCAPDIRVCMPISILEI